MARPREFDPEQVLEDAMNVFWTRGYDAASLQILLKGMGMTRGSLYKAFTDKKSLFLRVLHRYEDEAVEPAIALLTTDPRDGVERILALFESVVDAVRSGDQRGCLLCSAAAGPAAEDDDVSKLVHEQLGKMRHAFGVALINSDAYGGLSDRDRSEMAAFLLSFYTGLRVLARSRAPIETIELSASSLKQVISPA